MENKKGWWRKRGWGINAAITATIVWLGFGAWMIYRGCNRFPVCLGLNEWGDFFAGFLAAPAFVWFVIGYFMQSKELELHRRELKLQRKEMSDMVDAAEAQARSTEILANIEKNREENEYKKYYKTAEPLFLYEDEDTDGVSFPNN